MGGLNREDDDGSSHYCQNQMKTLHTQPKDVHTDEHKCSSLVAALSEHRIDGERIIQ